MIVKVDDVFFAITIEIRGDPSATRSPVGTIGVLTIETPVSIGEIDTEVLLAVITIEIKDVILLITINVDS